MAGTAFLGMRGTDDWTVTGERPKSWREGFLYLYPNGKMPLTAISGLAKGTQETDPEFSWFRKELPDQTATITGIYSNINLSTTVDASGTAAGTTIYLKMSAAHSNNFRAGHQALALDASQHSMTVNGKITSCVQNGASSYVALKLLEADDNGTTTGLEVADTLVAIGTINPEGGEMPKAVSYDASRLYNYTQIFRNSLAMTRTARKTRLRTMDAYTEAKREALELHGIEKEKALIWGVASEGTGDNGEPERTTGGIIDFIKTNASANVNDYVTNETYDDTTWLVGGETWLNSMLELIFRKGSTERLGLCGSGALLGINTLASTMGTVNLEPGETSYGLKIVTWHTPFGDLHLKTHPLFSYVTAFRNQILILDPSQISRAYIDDTTFKSDKNSVNSGSVDATKEEFLTEDGLRFGFPEVCGLLNGVGQDNPA